MGTFIWMFIDDNDDEFKVYQRNFRKMEAQNAESKLLEEIDRIKEERIVYEKKVLEAENNFDLKEFELLDYQLKLDTAKAKFYKANMNYLESKAIVEAKKYNYETQKLHYHGMEPLKIEQEYFELVASLNVLKLTKEDKESDVLEIEGKITKSL